jgi:hypothetical protein
MSCAAQASEKRSPTYCLSNDLSHSKAACRDVLGALPIVVDKAVYRPVHMHQLDTLTASG